MKKIIFLILLSACGINLPAQLPETINSPIFYNNRGKIVTVYIERVTPSSYTVVGIHPLSGREFLIKTRDGKITKQEYGYIFSKGEVREILEEILK